MISRCKYRIKSISCIFYMSLFLSILVFNSCVSLAPKIGSSESFPPKKESADQKQESKNDNNILSVQNVLISNNVRDISADNRSVWIATDSGVSLFDRESGKWKHYTKEDGLGSDNVNAVAIDGDWVWFGTDNGVSRFDRTRGIWRMFSSKDGLKGKKVFCITVDNDYVWFGTDEGLNRYDRNIDSWAARTKKDGLTDNKVSAITITDDYMWIGTQWSGVNRYDKTTDSWNTYGKKDGIIDTAITAIAATDKYIWFGTNKSGISLYDRINQTFVKNYTKTDYLSSNDIRAITVDGSQIWIGTANGGVQRYIASVDTWVRYTQNDGLSSNNIASIKVFKNEVWFGTYDNGVTMYDKVSNKWRQFFKADTIPSDDINGVAIDSNGNLWIATNKGVARYLTKRDQWIRYGKKSGLTTDYATTIAKNGSQIWLGTSRGLAIFNIETEQWQYFTKTNGLSQDFITAISVKDDVAWIGTNKGITYLNLKTNDFGSIQGLKDRFITSILPINDCLWIGTNDGLWQYNIVNQNLTHWTTEHHLTDNYINTIIEWDNENLLIGTQNGISVYDASQGRISSFSDDTSDLGNVKVLVYDKDNNRILVGKSDGLVIYDTQAHKWVEPSGTDSNRFCKRSIRSIALGQGQIWLGTANGLVQYSADNDSWNEHKTLMTREPLRETSVSYIEFDGNYVWMSNWSRSKNGAILRYDKCSNTWQSFGREAILNDMRAESMTDVSRIVVDKDAVWFATNYGLLRYDKVKDIWNHYTKNDGLADNSIRNIACGNNVVWVSYWSTAKPVGTEISFFDKKTKIWKTIPIANLIFPRESVEALAVDGDDAWVGLGSSGVRKVSTNGEQITYSKEDGLAQNFISFITVDGDEIWFGHRQGWGGAITRYNKTKNTWQKYSENDVLVGRMIEKITATERYVWILYSYGVQAVTAYDKKMDEWITIKPSGSHDENWGSGVEDIAEDGDYLWLGTDGNWLKRFHLASGTWTTFDYSVGLLDDDVNDYALKVDERYVWVGTRMGLSRYDKITETWTNFTKQKALSENKITAVAVDERYVWCGTQNGLSRYDKLQGTWENYRHDGQQMLNFDSRTATSDDWARIKEERRNRLIDDAITSLAVDNRYLWVGTRMGANRYDKITDRWDWFEKENGLPGLDISSVIVDGYDVWMGTNAGLCKFPRMSDNLNAWVSYTSGVEIRQTAMTKEYATTLVSNEVWCIDAESDYIWVGTMRGVSRYDKKRDLWTTFTTSEGLPTNEIGSIKVDGDIVWFGSGEGIISYNKNTRDWTTFTTDNGLPSDRITCIAKDKDHVWFGTYDAGIIRYDKEKKSWQSFSKKDGLSHNYVISIAVDGDQIWIGTQRGLTRYDKSKNTFTVFTQYDDSEDL